MAVHLYRTHNKRHYLGILVSLVVFALLVIGAIALMTQTATRSDGEQVKLLKDALRRATADCYAVEGRYPPTLDYLVDNYGVVINHDKFIVSYSVFAENIMPDISVLEIGKESADDDADEYDDSESE